MISFAALLAAFAFVAALMGWPSCFAVDSPAVLAALSGGLACCAALKENEKNWILMQNPRRFP